MMENVRIGERFAFGDRGGVWQKTAYGKARNIYGENYGTEIDVPPDTPVYVHFGGSRCSHRGPTRERREGIQAEPREQSPTQQPDSPPVRPESEIKPEAPKPYPPRDSMDGISICVFDGSGEIVKIVGATASQVAAYVSADSIIVKQGGEAVDMTIIESAFNHENQTVYIKVRT